MRAERARLQGVGRPEIHEATPGADDTLTKFAWTFLRSREGILTDATIHTYGASYRLRIAPVLGDLPLHAITREAVECWWTDVRAKATSHAVARHALEALRAILKGAVEWERLAANPAAHLRLPAPNVHEVAPVERALMAPQLATLFAHAGSVRTETILRAAGECGLRRGEIIGLRWTDLDLQARRITVRRSVWQPRQKGAQPVEKPPKGKRARTLPITPRMAERLGEWRETSVVNGGADGTGYVWPGTGGRAMAADSPTQLVERAMKRAGLVDAEGDPLTTLHGLRHTMVSLALLAGQSLLLVSRMAGHADVQVTARVYAHLSDATELESVANALAALLEPATVGETVGEPEATAKT